MKNTDLPIMFMLVAMWGMITLPAYMMTEFMKKQPKSHSPKKRKAKKRIVEIKEIGDGKL